MQALISWYSNLEPREQVLIKFGGPLILLLVVYLTLSDGKSSSSGIELTTTSSPAASTKNISSNASLAKPSKATLELAERFNQLTPSTQARLVTAKSLNKEELTALASSAGFSQLTVDTLEADQLELTAKVNNPKQVENFLHQLAKLGWHWQGLKLTSEADLTTQVVLQLQLL